jgi:hypothetical protein
MQAIEWVLDALLKWLVICLVLAAISAVVEYLGLLPEGFDWDESEPEKPPDLRKRLDDPPHRWMSIQGGRVAHAVQAVSGQALMESGLEVTRRTMCGNFGLLHRSALPHCRKCERVLASRESNGTNADDRAGAQ